MRHKLNQIELQPGSVVVYAVWLENGSGLIQLPAQGND